MLRKKQNIIQTKEAPESRPNAKVTVQYIQPQRQSSTQSNPTSTSHSTMSTVNHTEELEVENVEYLEEPTNGEDFIEHNSLAAVKEEECEDVFYPNAIHCMLDLYRDVYENFINKYKKDEENNLFQVWQDIAKEMQESYFEFEAEQIRQKYSSLRQQYFDVKCSNDVENFEYFEQMHEIYKDPAREIIAKGGHVGLTVSEVVYKDLIVVKTKECDGKQNDHKDNFKSKEIVHKEHEFIDMVEKELQAIEEAGHIVHRTHELEAKTNAHFINELQSPAVNHVTTSTQFVKKEQKLLKRSMDDENPEENLKQKPKLNESVEEEHTSNVPAPCPETLDTNADVFDKSHLEFSLFHYNEQQERRHHEHMQLLQQQQQQQRDQLDLLEKSFKLHEKSLEQQSLLLQELIKRFPPA